MTGHDVSISDRWRGPAQGLGPITARLSANRLGEPFRRAAQTSRAAMRESAKKPAASARNFSARRAASPAPPSQLTGDAVGGNASAAPKPALQAKSHTRASALHNSQSKTAQTGLERRAILSAMSASISRTTARRRSASLSFLSVACQCITATRLSGDDSTRHMSMSRTIFCLRKKNDLPAAVDGFSARRQGQPRSHSVSTGETRFKIAILYLPD